MAHIVHMAIATDRPRVLVQCTAPGSKGNFAAIARQLLTSKRLPSADQRLTYKATPEHNFHLLIENGVRFLCLSATKQPARAAFVVLEAARNKFLAEFGLVAATATSQDAEEMQRHFAPILRELMVEVGDGGSRSSKVKEVQEKLDMVRDEAKRGIELALRNTEQLDVLDDKTEKLSLRATEFARASSRVRRRMWWASKKLQLLFALIIIVLLGILWAVFASSSN